MSGLSGSGGVSAGGDSILGGVLQDFTSGIGIHGKDIVGSFGSLGKMTAILGMTGQCHITIGSHQAHGRMTGTIVVELSLFVVVTQVLVERDDPVHASVEKFGGISVMVDVEVGVAMTRLASGVGTPLTTTLLEASREMVSVPVVNAHSGDSVLSLMRSPASTTSTTTLPARVIA